MEDKEYIKTISSFLSPAFRKLTEEKENQSLYDGTGIEDKNMEKQPGVAPHEIEKKESDDDIENIEDPEIDSFEDSNIEDGQPPTTLGGAKQESLNDISERERKTKLFDNFTELEKTVDYAFTSIKEKISIDLLDQKQFKIVRFCFDKFDDIKNKIRNFQLTSFIDREYEENLYVFMLLRSEFLTTLSYMRKALKLNQKEENKEELNKNNNK